MFILRKISGAGVEMNFNLGNSYSFIGAKENPEQFKEAKDKSVYKDYPQIYAFIYAEGGKAHQLSDEQKSYIMTSDGKTFSNVSKR